MFNSIKFITLIIIGLMVYSCGTTAYMQRKYSGYKVVNKEKIDEEKMVPIEVVACVTPQGYIKCERLYGALTECTILCRVPPDKWVKREEGYGGYEKKVFSKYYLTLQSPDGRTEKISASEWQYSGFNIGQVLGNPEK